MPQVVLLLLGLGLFSSLVRSAKVRYDNYNIYQVIPQTREHLYLLERLERTSDSLKFFTPKVMLDQKASILVAPHKQPEFLDILRDFGITNELVIEDFQRNLDAEEASSRRKSATYDWTRYHSLDETYEWLRHLEKQYPEKVKVLKGGSTYEGRDILGVKVSFKSGNKGVFLESGIHAREWIGPATVTFILNQLLNSNDTRVRDIAEKFDWYVFPHANPDGFVYTHTRDRLWRKTRSRASYCYGTDPNRNWDFYWNTVGASSFECSEAYAGKAAFSEIETRSMSDFIASLDGKIHTYLAFHSYSQLLLFPYGHTRRHAFNHADLQQIGNAAAVALYRRYGTKYTVGNVYETIYPAAGSSADWVYGTRGVNLTYTYELRPSSSSSGGFVLVADQIVPTGLETLDSVVALLEEAEKLKYYR